MEKLILLQSKRLKPMKLGSTWGWNRSARYSELDPKSPQAQRIRLSKFAINYLLYNPCHLNGAAGCAHPQSTCPNPVGARVVRSRSLLRPGRSIPTYDDAGKTSSKFGPYDHGWRLENFIFDILLGCKAGNVVDTEDIEAVVHSKSVTTKVDLTLRTDDAIQMLALEEESENDEWGL